MNYPVIVAIVSISITEETEQHIPMTTFTEEVNRASPSRNSGNNDEQAVDGGGNRRHGKATASSSHVEMGVHSDTRSLERYLDDTLGPQVEADSMEEGHQVLGRG